jgi:TolB protein
VLQFQMRRLFFLLSLFSITLSASLWAQRPNDLGPVDVVTAVTTVPIRVTGSPEEIDKLANFAFESHGRYRRVSEGELFLLRFTAVSGSRVQVDVLRNGSSVLNRTVTGTSLRNALLKAADVAVEVTSGGLKGFFASQLAFISSQSGATEVHTGDLYFGDVRQLTQDRASAMSPRWAPDGSKLVYTSFHRSNAADIYQIDMNTMQRTSFMSFKGTNQGARFSPDGSRVTMVLSGEGNPEVYVANGQGRAVSRRTWSSSVESSPVFSPDGRKILFVSDMAGGPQLYTLPVDGGRESRATRLPTNISRYCAEPDWNVAKPNLVAFSMRIGSGFQIGLYDFSTGKAAKQISKAPYDALEPSWLADGRHLVFTARSPNERSIWILDTVSGKQTKLSPSSLGRVSQASVMLK